MNRSVQIQQNLAQVINGIESANKSNKIIELVVVSKTWPVEDILTAYNAGIRDFGENYVQELIEKAQVLPEDINWHFIGSLQSNKVTKLLTLVPNLTHIHTIDSISKLQTVIKSAQKHRTMFKVKQLQLFLQVNISGEGSKHGFLKVDQVKEALEIASNATNVKVIGLMMIGELGESKRDFENFIKFAEKVTNLSVEYELKLSMGMSNDYLLAIEMGADFVRVGSAIFGAREPINS